MVTGTNNDVSQVISVSVICLYICLFFIGASIEMGCIP